jgi:hypothetical protein
MELQYVFRERTVDCRALRQIDMACMAHFLSLELHLDKP